VTEHRRRLAALVVSLLAAFGVGFGVAAIVQNPRTVTKLQVVRVNESTNLPVGCLRAIAVIRHLEGLTDLSRLPAMRAQFYADMSACRIPAACNQAFVSGGQLISNVQKTRADALAILRSFDAAVRDCR
jgi:hypothetical protein